MPLLNYFTDMSAHIIGADIQMIFGKAGVSAITSKCDDRSNIVPSSFRVKLNNESISFQPTTD